MNEPSMVNGPLCMNIDVLDEGTQWPPLRRGTRLIFPPVGAYNVTQWMQFITYRPAVVLIGRNGKHAQIRRRERLEDIVGPDEVPDWL